MRQNLLRILFVSALFLFGTHEAKACHGVPLIGFSASTNGSSVTVNASSDPATCGCGPYYLEVQLACFSAANYTGTAPACGSASWNTYPWYNSLLNVPNYTAAAGWPDNCVLEPYNPITIPFTSLCAGTVYVLRARERLCGNGSAGPWSTNYTFTTPGTPPNFWLTATASPTSICVGQQSQLNAVLNGNGGCGTGTPTFTWNPGNLIGQTVTVSPTVTTVYTVTCTGGSVACYPVPPVTVTVTVTPAPIPGLAIVSPPTVCQGGCVTLTLTGSNGNIQWQSSPNGITWTNIPGATTTPYTYCPVMSAMFFHAVVTSTCSASAVSNTVAVGITPVPTLTINPGAPSICLGQSVTLTVSGSSGYTWTGPNSYTATGPSITISPTVTGTYTVSTSGLCPATQTVTVVVNPPPVIVFSPPNPTICSGSSITIDAGSSANSYNWVPNTGITFLSASQDSVSAAPLTTTTYNVTSTSAAGCTASSNVTVTVNNIPALVLSADSITVCPNTNDTVTISGASTYVWSPMAGTNYLLPDGSVVEFNPAATTTYTVVGTTAAGCVDSTTVHVTVANNIVVDAGLPDSICPGASTNLLATGGNFYTWSSNNPATIVNGNTATPTVTPSVTTVFTVNVMNQAGCMGLDSVTVLVRNLPVPNAGPDTDICIGASTGLTGSGGNTYNWSGSNITSGSTTATPTVAPTVTSDYILTVTDIYGCQENDTVNVVVHALPPANAGPDQTICGNNCASLLATGGTQYAWTPPADLSSPNTAATQACPQVSSNYIVTVTDAFGCVNTDTVKIIVAPVLTVVASADASICPGNTAPVSAIAGGGNGGPYTYAWLPAAGLASTSSQSTTATPAVTTTYTVTLTDNCGSIAVIDSVTITVFPTPQISATPDITSGCAPVCVEFTGISNPAAASCSYDFGDQSTDNTCNPSHCFMNAGSYTVVYTVTDINGCPATVTYPNLVTVHPNPVAGFSVSPQTTSILNPVITITPTCTSCDTTTYSMGDILSSSVTNLVTPFNFPYTQPGTYTIVQYASNQYGCRDTATDYVIIEPDWSFYAPNAFTPNGDGKNDFFLVFGEGIDYATFQMLVFDRWGKQIFISTDINKGWDGKVNNSTDLAQIDTYVWSVHFRDENGDLHKFVGHVQMIR